MEKKDLHAVTLHGETYLKISNHDQLRPFLMSIVSDSNHWMFVSSNGGLTIGRQNSNYALFPYYTDDKLIENAESAGSRTLFWVTKGAARHLWQPFSNRAQPKVTRNLYKGEYGNKLIFEEINHDLDLTFRCRWSTSEEFGFIRDATLINNAQESVSITLLDGIENVMPYGVPENLQAARSNLVDAYKRSELDERSGLGIFALSAIIVDRAEPSEALKANIVWSLGLDNPIHLLSSRQVETFRSTGEILEEKDVKAERGAYFVSKTIDLSGHQQKEWSLVADVNMDAAQIENLSHLIAQASSLAQKIKKDIDRGTQNLINLVGSSDGLQLTADGNRNIRHYANTLFNIMRGGIFDNDYQIEKSDFSEYLTKANHSVFQKHRGTVDGLPANFSYQGLLTIAQKSEDPDLIRLSGEYLPLKFSRRHGDPSRPWNKFSINTQNEDGSKVLDYEGNWRDIFQNWEALAFSYPSFIEGMIAKFLNASTFEGYNPYRVTKGGFDWETIEPDDPWSYIGYWGDHQIIYLLKFLELAQNHFPEKLGQLFSQHVFVYANVPYKIKSYDGIVTNPKDTIDFDQSLDHIIRERRKEMGADGALMTRLSGEIHHVNFIEKILATTLSKLSNFVAEGGIWLNTQRPEWNDANNALVGNGVSMVTLYYLRRFFAFFRELLEENQSYQISEEISNFYQGIASAFSSHKDLLDGSFTSSQKRGLLDQLGKAGSDYRNQVYQSSFSGNYAALDSGELIAFCDLIMGFLEHSIRANEREDGMYHAYNILTLTEDEATISHLSEMLEGQVAVLSSGYLSSIEALKVLDAMKGSKLFREDQYSYLLYPKKDLPGFLSKNILAEETVNSSTLLQKLVEDGNEAIIKRDIQGQYHFNGGFRNADYLSQALDELSAKGEYQSLVAKDRQRILDSYEAQFNHKAFTGRSGTFYGYEGLGSIYWHMVSKLVLAALEICLKAKEDQESEEVQGRLIAHFYEILEGIGVHKSPELYGAFPTDPYSHTPFWKGVQQPGMTGQVKEDVISRVLELGVFVKEGKIRFEPILLRSNEFLTEASTFNYISIGQIQKSIPLAPNNLAFSYCQVPIIYEIGSEQKITLSTDDEVKTIEGNTLDAAVSTELFNRTGSIQSIKVQIRKDQLK